MFKHLFDMRSFFYDILIAYSLLGKFIALAALQLMKPVGDPFLA